MVLTWRGVDGGLSGERPRWAEGQAGAQLRTPVEEQEGAGVAGARPRPAVENRGAGHCEGATGVWRTGSLGACSQPHRRLESRWRTACRDVTSAP